MARSARLLAALLFAPLTGAILGALTSALIATISAPSIAVFLFQFLYLLPWIIGATCATTLTLGMGFHLVARRFNWSRFATYWIGGGAIAGGIVLAATLLALGAPDAMPDPLSDCIQYLAIALPTGIATAGICWLIRRPDRDSANPTTSPP